MFLPKKNVVIEKRNFFTRNRQPEETIVPYITELRNLSSTCELLDIRGGLILYKLVDGIKSNQVKDVLLPKGSNLDLKTLLRYAEKMELQKSNCN